MEEPPLHIPELTPEAQAQLREIGAYIAGQGVPIAAEHLVARILTAVEGLRYFPTRGRSIGRYRELIVGAYTIRYRVASLRVVVTRIRHAARKPD